MADRYLDVRDEEDLPLRAAAADAGVQDDESERIASARREREYEPAAYSAPALASVAAAGAHGVRLGASEQAATDGREGLRILPLALTLVAGLLLGFGAGYFVGGRQAEQSTTTSSAAGTTGAAGTPQQPSGREWSEQAVSRPQAERGESAAQPPSVAPPVPSESPAESAASTAASEPSRPAAATRGRLVVQSAPARAGVTVNGEWRGRTPLTLDDLRFGRYDVRVVQPGFTVEREEVTLSRSQPARTLSFTLRRTASRDSRAAATETAASSKPLTGLLFVDSRPRGAQVFVDGRLVGRTPVSLPELRIGSHVVRLELSGHARWSTSTTIVSGQEARVTGSLDPIQ